MSQHSLIKMLNRYNVGVIFMALSKGFDVHSHPEHAKSKAYGYQSVFRILTNIYDRDFLQKKDKDIS